MRDSQVSWKLSSKMSVSLRYEPTEVNEANKPETAQEQTSSPNRMNNPWFN